MKVPTILKRKVKTSYKIFFPSYRNCGACKQLSEIPAIGTSLGNDVYKIRLAVASKNKGKSGGMRIISFVKIIDETVFLLSIFNKGQKDTISDKEIEELLKDYL